MSAEAVDGRAAREAAGAAGNLPSDRPRDDHGPDDRPPLRTLLESVLLVIDEPVPELVLASVLETPTADIAAALRSLAREYDDAGRGFDLREVAGGWRLYTRPECAPWVERYVLDGQSARLTQAALETLAVIAYRQPVTRARISAVRGVNVDGVVRTLLSRGLVTEAGQDGATGGTLYRTTPLLLERLGLQSLDELPDLAPLLPELSELAELADGHPDQAHSHDTGPTTAYRTTPGPTAPGPTTPGPTTSALPTDEGRHDH